MSQCWCIIRWYDEEVYLPVAFRIDAAIPLTVAVDMTMMMMMMFIYVCYAVLYQWLCMVETGGLKKVVVSELRRCVTRVRTGNRYPVRSYQ